MSDLRRAVALFNSEQYAAALPLFKAALRQSEQQPGGPSAQTAGILYRIGCCCFAQSEFRAAAEYCRHAVSISNLAFEERLQASLMAAHALRNMNDFAEVESQIKASLSIIDTERLAGTTAPAVLKAHRAEILALSAKCLSETGRYSETLPLYEEIMTYYESIGNAELLVECLTGLGEIYIAQGLSDKALAMARRAQTLNTTNLAR